jgi:hypothetical protein
MMISFKDWLMAQEDSAVGRSKTGWAFGTGVRMPPASLNSRATISPGLLDMIKGDKKWGYTKNSEDKLDKEFGDKIGDWGNHEKDSKKKAK